MKVVGLAIDVRGGSPACCVVVTTTDSGTTTLDQCFELTSAGDPLPQQLEDLYSAIKSRLTALAPVDVIVVRQADAAPIPRNTSGPKIRLMAEGAILAAASKHADEVYAGTGADCGRWHKSSKAEVGACGEKLIAGEVRTAVERKRFGAAAAAALAGAVRAQE